MKPDFPIATIDSLDIDFNDNGEVYSNNYSDIYFQGGIGIQEKHHVFIKGNHLPERWQHKNNFVIAETGFGTGLNFLLTWQAWNKNKGQCQKLDFISCELHPLNKQQLKQALNIFTELAPLAEQLLKKYPDELYYGIHRLELEDLTLTLVFGEALTCYQQMTAEVDAWYLDGFGPSKNPEMWTDELFQAIARLSHYGTTAATFTVARKIRDGLSQVGFAISKSEGFGQKREMLKANLKAKDEFEKSKQPWAQTFKASKTQSVCIIGAGIAGLSLADQLIKKGVNVTVIDRHASPCLEASGNPQAMIMPMLTLRDSNESRFYLRAFNYACQYYSKESFNQDGVLQFAVNDKEKKWVEKLFKNYQLPESLVRSHKKGLIFPTSGWLHTQSHAQQIASRLSNYIQTEITQMTFKDQQWDLQDKSGLCHKSDVVVLANAMDSQLLVNYDLPLTPKHGQISYFKSDENYAVCQSSQVLLHEGYITPQLNGCQTIGATFDHIKNEHWHRPATLHNNHWQRNTDLWQDTRYYNELMQLQAHQTRAGIRVSTPDHLPICGALIDQSQFKKDYADIRHGKHWKSYPNPIALENLYLFTGLGSRGYTSAPLLSEFLCNQILGHPQILEHSMQECINPNRFLFKALKKF